MLFVAGGVVVPETPQHRQSYRQQTWEKVARKLEMKGVADVKVISESPVKQSTPSMVVSFGLVSYVSLNAERFSYWRH